MAHLPRTTSGSIALSHDVPYSRPASPHQHPPQLGFYGLGSMGYEMATNLALHPHAHPSGPMPPLLVYNRTRAKADKLLQAVGQDKARIAKDLAQLVKECDVIITSFASDAVVQEAYHQFYNELKASDKPLTRSKIFVETSTIYPTLAGDLDRLVSEIPHVHFLSCPVTGAPAAAKARQLVLFLGGNYLAKKEVAYLLIPSIARKAVDLGGNVEKAATFKLIGNAYILGQLELMSEAMTLAEKTGVGADNFAQYVKELFPAPPILHYLPKLLNDEFDGSKGFAIDGGVKDASHIRRLTGDHNCPMPVIDIAHQHLLTARSVHLGRQLRGDDTFDVLDWSAIIAGSRLAAGLDAFDSSKKSARVVKDD